MGGRSKRRPDGNPFVPATANYASGDKHGEAILAQYEEEKPTGRVVEVAREEEAP